MWRLARICDTMRFEANDVKARPNVQPGRERARLNRTAQARGNEGGYSMEDQKTRLKEKMPHWDRLLEGCQLPGWDDFPELPLYMDQVIYLMNQYLSPLDREENHQQVTPAMINNYVKLAIMPRPVKKRYDRVHLAFLIMVCVLKQTVSTAEIKKLIPVSSGEKEIRPLYENFRDTFQGAKNAFRENMARDAEHIIESDADSISALVFRTAVISSLSREWAERILSLYPEAEDHR